MKILLTNDDGIDAVGLATLFECIRRIAAPDADIFVVAPDRGRSECGHGVTTGRPLRIGSSNQPQWFSTDGTPVDCVRAALGALCPNPDLVISGINEGANLGVDTLVSGTVAAAREASLNGIPAIAISQYRDPRIERSWDVAIELGGMVLQTLIEEANQSVVSQAALSTKELRSNSERNFSSKQFEHPMPLWNVNLPAMASVPSGGARVAHCNVDPCPHARVATRMDDEISFDWNFQNRPRLPDYDIDQCFGGSITVSRLKVLDG